MAHLTENDSLLVSPAVFSVAGSWGLKIRGRLIPSFLLTDQISPGFSSHQTRREHLFSRGAAAVHLRLYIVGNLSDHLPLRDDAGRYDLRLGAAVVATIQVEGQQGRRYSFQRVDRVLVQRRLDLWLKIDE